MIDLRSSACGAVFIELALALSIFLLLLAGATDYSRWQRENLILHQAAKHAVHTAANLPSTADNDARLQAGLDGAVNYIGNMGLNPFRFDYEIWTIVGRNAFSMKIKATPLLRRHVLVPNGFLTTCGSARMSSAHRSNESLARTMISPSETSSMSSRTDRSLSCSDEVNSAPEPEIGVMPGSEGSGEIVSIGNPSSGGTIE